MNLELDKLGRFANELIEAERKLLLAKCAHSDALSAQVTHEGQREKAAKARDEAEAFRDTCKRVLHAHLTPEAVVELVERARRPLRRFEPILDQTREAAVKRIYRNNEEGTAIVETIEMTRAELDAALSVARETAYRAAQAEAERQEDAELGPEASCFTQIAGWCADQAAAEARKRGAA